MTWTVGVDPGLSGAVAVLGSDGQLLHVFDMPATDGHVSGAALADQLAGGAMPAVAWIEDVHAMPGQGVSSTFKFGRSVGVVAGVLGALYIPVRWVPPTRWKRALGLPADKGAARRRAQEMWPGNADLFARAKDDGRAEAALIAHYGRTRT